jgi:hypothetical protein
VGHLTIILSDGLTLGDLIYLCICLYFLTELGSSSALCLQSRHSTARATPPVRFASLVLEMGEEGVSRTICPGWS